MTKKQKSRQPNRPAGNKGQQQHTAQTKGQPQKGRTQSRKASKADLTLPLNKTNYSLIALGFLVVIIGFFLMSGDENIYNFRKLTLSIITIAIGYGVIGYGIMRRSDTGESHEKEEKTSVS